MEPKEFDWIEAYFAACVVCLVGLASGLAWVVMEVLGMLGI